MRDTQKRSTPPRSRKPSPPKQVVRIALPIKLVAALDRMRDTGDPITERTLPDMIRRALKYSVWRWSHGTGPNEEMAPSLKDPRGWPKWDERVPDDWALEAEAANFAGNSAELERMLGAEEQNPPDEARQ